MPLVIVPACAQAVCGAEQTKPKIETNMMARQWDIDKSPLNNPEFFASYQSASRRRSSHLFSAVMAGKKGIIATSLLPLLGRLEPIGGPYKYNPGGLDQPNMHRNSFGQAKEKEPTAQGIFEKKINRSTFLKFLAQFGCPEASRSGRSAQSLAHE